MLSLFTRLYILLQIALITFTLCQDDYSLNTFFVPSNMYYNTPLNYIGTVCMTIICYLLFLPTALLYWIYVLFTFD